MKKMLNKKTRQFNVRIPTRLLEDLADFNKGESMSSIAIQALTEWVRMNNFPGIDFRWTPTGRKPHVTGTGLSVWELYHIWKDHNENIEKLLKNYPHISRSQVNAAISYAKAYLDEISAGEWGTKPPFVQKVKI